MIELMIVTDNWYELPINSFLPPHHSSDMIRDKSARRDVVAAYRVVSLGPAIERGCCRIQSLRLLDDGTEVVEPVQLLPGGVPRGGGMCGGG